MPIIPAPPPFPFPIPIPVPAPDSLGKAIGKGVMSPITIPIEGVGWLIWQAGSGLMQVSFLFADLFGQTTVSTRDGPVGDLWPIMLWLSVAIALGLFFWQIIMVNVRGGSGFWRLVTGPAQYGVALAVTVGAVATLINASEMLAFGILHTGLGIGTFGEAWSRVWATETEAGQNVSGLLMGLIALFGFIPAAFGWAAEMVIRAAAIYAIVATIPISAAGLLADSTARWYWTALRGAATAIMMPAAFALEVVIGAKVIREGVVGGGFVAGPLAGATLLLGSIFTPLLLFRLFSFIDPNKDAGNALRGALEKFGLSSSGSNSAASRAAQAEFGAVKDAWNGSGDDDEDGGGMSPLEAANMARFAEFGGGDFGNMQGEAGSEDESGTGDSGDEDSDTEARPDDQDSDPIAGGDGQSNSEGGSEDDPQDQTPPSAPPGDDDDDDDDSGGGSKQGGGDGPPDGGGGGGGGQAASAAEAGAIVL